jgi:DNA-binding CsgD family transcriptional regulator
LKYADHGTALEARDDGCGFDPQRANGFELHGTRSRVKDLGGELLINSNLGAGTKVTVWVPGVCLSHCGFSLPTTTRLCERGWRACSVRSPTWKSLAKPPMAQKRWRSPRHCDADIVRAVEAGATGYLLKDTPRAELASALRAAARGETVLAPPVAARLVTRMRRPNVDALTPRETEVLRLVARGLTNAQIGQTLFIGEATVKTHLLKIFSKLGVDDRTRAVTVAMERGILPSPS